VPEEECGGDEVYLLAVIQVLLGILFTKFIIY
jgi:hypothetical protein